MLEDCEHCCRHSARVLLLFRKALRRRYPNAQLLNVREVKPQSGAFDWNIVVHGVPPVTRRTRGGRRVKELWSHAGGGFLDLGDGKKRRAPNSAGGLGRYIGKYVSKLAHRRMAKGFRRYTRTKGFAPSIRMVEPREATDRGPVCFLGWVNPESLETMPRGFRFLDPVPL